MSTYEQIDDDDFVVNLLDYIDYVISQLPDPERNSWFDLGFLIDYLFSLWSDHYDEELDEMYDSDALSDYDEGNENDDSNAWSDYDEENGNDDFDALSDHYDEENEDDDHDDVLKYLKIRTHHAPAKDGVDPQVESEMMCAICQSEFEHEENIGTLQCGHEYHTDCIKQWLLRKKDCPMCRASVLP